jgi:hypothetical protein
VEDVRTEYVEDDIREGLIKHWEVHLNNSLHAVYVAQQQLDKLYRSRYREIGSAAIVPLVSEPEVSEQAPDLEQSA